MQNLISKMISFLAAGLIAALNLSTAKILVQGDWDSEKLIVAYPIALTACLLFDQMVSEEYGNERLRSFAKHSKEWIENQSERLLETPLGRIRYEEYEKIFDVVEAPFLKRSNISILHYCWIVLYLLIEFMIGVYLLQQRESDLPWWVAIAPILAGLLNFSTGLLKGKLIVYPQALRQMKTQYRQYEENLSNG